MTPRKNKGETSPLSHREHCDPFSIPENFVHHLIDPGLRCKSLPARFKVDKFADYTLRTPVLLLPNLRERRECSKKT